MPVTNPTALHDALTTLALQREGVPPQPALPQPGPMPAATELRAELERLTHLRRRAAQRDQDSTLAQVEAADARRVAEAAEADHELDAMDGPGLDAARAAAAAAHARAAEMTTAAQVLHRAVGQAEAAVVAAREDANGEIRRAARARLDAAVARYAALLPVLAGIAGELDAAGHLLGDPAWIGALDGVPGPLTGPSLALVATPPADPELTALGAAQRDVWEAARIADRIERQAGHRAA